MVAMNEIQIFGENIGRQFSAEKVRQRLEMGDGFMRQILEEGKVLYEADNCSKKDAGA